MITLLWLIKYTYMLTPAADWVLIRFYCAFMLRVTENSCKVKTS